MRRDGTMRLADFVSAILHLTMAFEVFKSKDSNQDNQVKMNLNEVKLTIFKEFFNNIFFLVDKIGADMLIEKKIINKKNCNDFL